MGDEDQGDGEGFLERGRFDIDQLAVLSVEELEKSDGEADGGDQDADGDVNLVGGGSVGEQVPRPERWDFLLFWLHLTVPFGCGQRDVQLSRVPWLVWSGSAGGGFLVSRRWQWTRME